MKLAIDWPEFKSELEKLILLGESIILRLNQDKDLIALNRLCNESSELQESIRLFFQNNLVDSTIPKEIIIIGSDKARAIRSPDLIIQSKTHAEVLGSLIFRARFYMNLISVCDKVTKNTNLEMRLSAEATNSLILSKLYSIYDDNYYPISLILEGNGVRTKRLNEAAEIGDYLKRMGYIELNNFGNNDRARLTLDGKLKVEEFLGYSEINFSDVKVEKSEVDRKIDEVIEKLHTLCDGQEIIFDELEKLKGLYDTLNSRQWHQLLFGTIFQAASEKVIDVFVAHELFQKFVSENLHLK